MHGVAESIEDREGAVANPTHGAIGLQNPVFVLQRFPFELVAEGRFDPFFVIRMNCIHAGGVQTFVQAFTASTPDFFICGTYLKDLTGRDVDYPEGFRDCLANWRNKASLFRWVAAASFRWLIS